MGNPFWNKRIHETQQKMSRVLENLQTLNIKFKNGNPNAQTAELFKVSDKIMTQDITDGNVGSVIQNNIIGTGIPSNFVTAIYSTPDYFFAGTNLGVWIYDRATNTGTTIDTSVAVTGDDLPSNDIYGLFYDEYRFVLYVATNGGGLWVYNFLTATGTTINMATVVVGDALQSDVCFSVTVDLVNNIVYVGNQDGVWKFTVATSTGKAFTATGGVASGDNCTGAPVSVTYDYVDEFLWAGMSSGVWRYNNLTGNGKIFTSTSGAGSGDQLPNNWAWNIDYGLGSDTVFVATANGLWAYTISTDTGLIINSSTPVFGDALPSDNILGILYNNTLNTLFAGTDSGLWIFDMTTSTGSVYDTTTVPATGDPLPSNTVYRLHLDSGGDLAVATYGGGLWILNLVADSTELYQAPTPSGSTLPSNIVLGITACESTNIMYASTFSGMFKYIVNTGVGKVFTTSGGAAFGVQLPSNICTGNYYDQTHNIVYIGTFLGLWKYNVATDTGSKFTTAGGAGLGDQLPNNFVYGVFVDEATNTVYVATAGGFWRYITGTDTGKKFLTSGGAGSGDQLPSNACTDCSKYPGADYVWVTTNGGGVWRYDEVLDVGKTYNTAGGATGQQVPSNILWNIAIESDVVWFATSSGIWKYRISTDTGLVINDTTPITSGVPMPEPYLIAITIDPVNQILWVGTDSYGVWEYQITIDEGRVYNATGGQSQGSGVPSNNIQSLYYDATNQLLWAGTRGGGVWKYILNNTGLIGTAFINLSTSTYDYISQCIDIINSPIVIFMMKITITGSLTYNNIIRYMGKDMFGIGYQRVIRLGDYISALTNQSGDVIDVPIPDGIIVSQNRYFEYPLDPLEEVDITIYYSMLEIANILRRQMSLIENSVNVNPLDGRIDQLF
jgi:ligand-binding sensor domain-containing protein